MQNNQPNEDGERGVIINTASVAAFEPQMGQVAYAASKAAVVGMTLAIARDLARSGIRCCTIAPGTFDTPLTALMPQPMKDGIIQHIPFPKRFGRAGGVRRAGPADRGERVLQRGDHPAGRGRPLPAEVALTGPGEPER